MAVPRLHADVITIDWVGTGTTNSAIDPGNWVAAGDSEHTPYAPAGGENFRFGELTPTGTSIYVPVLNIESPVPVPLNDLIFSNTASPSYSFTFSGDSNSTSGLNLAGNVSVASGGTVTVNDNLAFLLNPGSHSVTVDCNSSLIVNAPVIDYGTDGDGDGSSSIDKWGTGTLVLNSGLSDFSGGLTVHEGTLLIGASSHPAVETETVHEPAGGPVGTGTLKMEAGTTLGLVDSGSYQLCNLIDLGCSGGLVTIDTGCGELSLYGQISGSGGITKKGDGILALYNGDSDFTGGVTVKRGTLVIGASSEGNYSEEGHELLGVLSGPVGTGTLKFETNCVTPTLALADNGCYTLHNDIDLGCFEGTVNFDTGCGNLTLEGYISGTAGMTKLGAGTLTLKGQNDMEGDFYVSQGTVNADNDRALGYGALEFGNSEGSTVQFNTANPEIGGLEGDSANDIINLAGPGGVGANLTIYQSEDSTYAGQITGAGSLTKENCGTLTLSGYNNSYSGGTTINGGTLVAAANYTLGTGNVNVNNGGTLTLQNSDQNNLVCVNNGGTLNGNGWIAIGRINVGGTLSPGTANCPIGELDFGDLTLAGTSTLVIGVKSDGEGVLENSTVDVQNSETLDISSVNAGSPLTLKLVSEGLLSGLVAGQQYSITFLTFDHANGADLVLYSSLSLDTTGFNTGFGDVSYTLVGGEGSGFYTLNFTPVPEPSTYALLGLGLCLSGFAAWRKRRNA